MGEKGCTEEEGEEVGQLVDEEEDEMLPPEGGFGWVIVVAAFCVQFCVLGTMNNFGILYTSLLDEFKQGRQKTCECSLFLLIYQKTCEYSLFFVDIFYII